MFFAAGATAQDNVIDKVEWVVGDKAILRSDIENTMKYWIMNGQKFYGDPYTVVGEDLAVQQLFLHQAALDSVEVKYHPALSDILEADRLARLAVQNRK